MSEVLRSLYFDQNEILSAILDLHCDKFECDATYGNGSFWRKLNRPEFCYDIDPQKPEAIKADCANLPHDKDSLNSIVFDPPFLTYVKNARKHKEGKPIMSARYGGYWRYDELLDHYRESIKEFHRILNKKGILVFKCQDITHNHKHQSTHTNVIRMAEEIGFRLKDLFILGAKSRMKSPQKGKQKHARVFHSYFLVFIKEK